MKRLLTTENGPQAELIRSRLQEAGINALTHGTGLAAYTQESGAQEIYVGDDDLERAREVLKSYEGVSDEELVEARAAGRSHGTEDADHPTHRHGPPHRAAIQADRGAGGSAEPVGQDLQAQREGHALGGPMRRLVSTRPLLGSLLLGVGALVVFAVINLAAGEGAEASLIGGVVVGIAVAGALLLAHLLSRRPLE